MDLLALSERREAKDPALDKVRLLPERCLHSRCRFVSCTACSDLCPAGAIEPGKPPILEEALCANCMACIPACPVAAFTAAGEAAPLLPLAARKGWQSIEIVCASHPAPELGGHTGGAAVRLDGCLASLGIGTYLTLIALGTKEIVVRIDACRDCQIGQLCAGIVDQVTAASQLLVLLRRPESILACDVPKRQAHRARRIANIGAPPLTRREFLRLGAGAAHVLPEWLVADNPVNGEKHPPTEQRLMFMAVKSLELGTPPKNGSMIQGLNFPMLSVSRASCTACGACSRACPTGALQLFKDEETRLFRLIFRISACIHCRICVHVCQPKAIRLGQLASFEQLFRSDENEQVAAGEFARCERCGIDFALYDGSRFCKLCAERQRHLVSTKLPWSHLQEKEVS